MGKVERAIEAMEALPEHRREELADMILEIAEAVREEPGRSVLSEAQRQELEQRRASGFQRGDASRIDALLARLA